MKNLVSENRQEYLHRDFRNVDWPSTDLLVTSPPYKDEDGYTVELMGDFISLFYDVMKNDTLAFVNFGHLAGFKERPFEVAFMMKDMGFNWVDTITWYKCGHFRPLAGSKRVNNLTEFIFMMAKGNPSIDRLSIGVPYKDKSNIKRWKGTKGKDLRCGGNLWPMNYDTVQSKKQKFHNDRFPLELPERCIKLSGISKGSMVSDPFGGSGNTALAAKNLGMDFTSSEIKEEHYKTATERLEL